MSVCQCIESFKRTVPVIIVFLTALEAASTFDCYHSWHDAEQVQRPSEIMGSVLNDWTHSVVTLQHLVYAAQAIWGNFIVIFCNSKETVSSSLLFWRNLF